MNTRGFHNEPADRYDLVHTDGDASTTRQGRALDSLLTAAPGPCPSRTPPSTPWSAPTTLCRTC
ncbi:hypothetical protein ACFYNM_25920 [Streptomyces spororaveus]|uniref:hypothetical protein n=1 Tax=Streptomyces spororaveus TaxID=284039 RepID=UPI0036A21985